MDFDTGQVRQIHDSGGMLIWSTDGEKITVFQNNTFFVVRADGSGIVGEVKIPDEYIVNFSYGNAWSPERAQLAFSLKIFGPDNKNVAIGLLDKTTLEIRILEDSFFSPKSGLEAPAFRRGEEKPSAEG